MDRIDRLPPGETPVAQPLIAFVYLDQHAGPSAKGGPRLLREREEWAISPCNKCGATEVFDPPCVMAKFRFPDAPPDAVVESFTSFCSMCGGRQLLNHLG